MSAGASLAFLFCAAVALVGAWKMITCHHPVHSALYLVTNFVASAGIYLLLGAPFIALVQVAVYAGAIMVLFLFILMYLNVGIAADLTEHRTRRLTAYAAAGVVALLIIAGGAADWAGAVAAAPAKLGAAAVGDDPVGKVAATRAASFDVSVEAIGTKLFSDYALPFEVAGVLLLVALIGALVIASPQLRREAAAREEASS